MKFNYCATGDSGIGGILRDSNSNFRTIFSKSIGVADSNLVELLAVHEVMKLFVPSSWVSSHKLLLESDSSNVVKRISNQSSVFWRLRWLINKIENLKLLISEWSVNHTQREANVVVDSLAKARVNR
ncbi:hypothetical protein PTKIN_Ptkin15bG0059300 [Pterospermum kingtungense]